MHRAPIMGTSGNAERLQPRKEQVMKPNRKIAAALTFSSIALSGCYVVPVVDPQGNVQYQHYPLPPAGTQVVAVPAAYAAPAGYPAPHPGAAFPVVLNARAASRFSTAPKSLPARRHACRTTNARGSPAPSAHRVRT